MWSKLICFCSLLPNLTVANLPCSNLHLYLPGTIKILKEKSSQQQRQSCSFQRIVYVLSIFKLIFITQTKPKINTSSEPFGPCVQGAVSVQIFNHMHFYKPLCVINSVRAKQTHLRTPFGLEEWKNIISILMSNLINL